jgi:hypothetical protein
LKSQLKHSQEAFTKIEQQAKLDKQTLLEIHSKEHKDLKELHSKEKQSIIDTHVKERHMIVEKHEKEKALKGE